jgi:hypothetical protein
MTLTHTRHDGSTCGRTPESRAEPADHDALTRVGEAGNP